MRKFVSFFEIPAADFRRAVKFYETIFGSTLEVMECESEKMAFFKDEQNENCGAISWAEGFNPSKDGVMVSLRCKDIAATLQLIGENGGKTEIGKTQIECEGAGYFAVFIDCEGNRLGLWSEK